MDGPAAATLRDRRSRNGAGNGVRRRAKGSGRDARQAGSRKAGRARQRPERDARPPFLSVTHAARRGPRDGAAQCASALPLRQLTGRLTGPLSQSWTDEMLGTPQSSPFQPLKPSILNVQKPVVMSLTTIRPSALRTSTPKAPLNME